MSFLQLLLSPVSLIYAVAVLFDRAVRSRRQKRLPRPVISVGNITVGGTGKTPLLIRLTNDLKKMGVRPAILTRGYRGFGAASSSTQLESDEILLMREKCPGVLVGAGADRFEQAQRLLKEHPVDVFLLDDGFQHWPLARDLDIVCVDATDPWGGGALLPAGRLREPATALKRANAVVLTRGELVPKDSLDKLRRTVQEKIPDGLVLQSYFHSKLVRIKNGEEVPLDLLNDATILAVSALGNPMSFEETLRRLGADVVSLRFPDHHLYREEDVVEAQTVAKEESASMILITEKDCVKIKTLIGIQLENLPVPIFVFSIVLQFPQEDERRWMEILKRYKP